MSLFGLNLWATRFLWWLADLSLRTLLLAAVAGLAIIILACLKRRSAALEHAIWTAVLIAILSLPALQPLLPSIKIDAPTITATPTVKIPARQSNLPQFSPGALVVTPSDGASYPWQFWTGIAYLAGLFAFSSRLIFGWIFTRRLLSDSRSIEEELWQHSDLTSQVKVAVRIQESARARVPLTTEWNNTRVILPVAWREWSQQKLRTVLAHELAHAARRDWLIGLVAAINKAVFWFNPLSWWLEARLAVLAERAADDAVIVAQGDAPGYARVLIEIASALKDGGGRMLWNTTSMAGMGLIGSRVDRILKNTGARRVARLGYIARITLCSAALAFLWCAAALQIQRPVQAQITPQNRISLGYIWENPNTGVPSADEAAKLEGQLAADPENEEVRSKLLSYYLRHGMREQRNNLIYWLIEHHPESPLHQYQRAAFVSDSARGTGGVFITPEDYQRAVQLWQLQVSKHPDDPMVLSNASRIFARSDAAQEVGLLKRAQELDPKRFSDPLADLYGMILMSSGIGMSERYSTLAPQIKSELESSSNVSFVGTVARRVVTSVSGSALRNPGGDKNSTQLRQLAIDLVTRAQALEPQNQEWSDLMVGAKALPLTSASQPIPPPSPANPSAPKSIRVGGNVQAAKLITSPPPVYPPLARQARIQGIVRFNVTIDKDGHVSNVTLVSGHPLLIPPAMEAVRQYAYQKNLLNGEPVEVLTTVDVPFTLN
jgi:TonB family protein